MKETDLTEEDYSFIYERDEGICQSCGETGECVHHIIALSKEKHKDFTKMCLVCNKCHNMIHNVYGAKKYEGPLLERARINTEKFGKKITDSGFDAIRNE